MISMRSPLSIPVVTSRAVKRPSPSATMTRSLSPVRISASSGIDSTFRLGLACSVTRAYMFGLSFSSGLSKRSLAISVRVFGSRLG